MYRCGSSKNTSLKRQDLSKENFPAVSLKIQTSTLRFDANEGKFRQVSNADPFYRSISEADRLMNEEARLSKELVGKREKLAHLQSKLADIAKQQEKMRKVLNVDINEKEYLSEVKAKYQAEEEEEQTK